MKKILIIIMLALLVAIPVIGAEKPDPALEAWQQKVDKVNLEKENAILRMQIMQANFQQQQEIVKQKDAELKALQNSKPGKKDEKKAK